jgi:hypothetical protein
MSKSLITLPPPCVNSQISLETVIAQCCPIGPYTEEQLTGEQIGQLLWAAHTATSVYKRRGTNGSTWLILYVCRADGVWRWADENQCCLGDFRLHNWCHFCLYPAGNLPVEGVSAIV